MDHMEYSIALPSCAELTNAGSEWTKMKQRLYIHLNPNSFHHVPNHSASFLINISLEQVQEVFNMHGLSIEETNRFNKILKSIEDLCLPRFLIIYNRYRFFTCKQNGPEFNGFLQQLLAWSDLCEFGDLKDILLKDCILSGITEESVRQLLLRTEQLDFHKTVEICKAGLVRKHGGVNTKSKESSCADAWTVTETDIMTNEYVVKPPMKDKATYVTVRTRNMDTQTDAVTMSDASCEVVVEQDLMSKELIHDSSVNSHMTCVSHTQRLVDDDGKAVFQVPHSVAEVQCGFLCDEHHESGMEMGTGDNSYSDNIHMLPTESGTQGDLNDSNILLRLRKRKRTLYNEKEVSEDTQVNADDIPSTSEIVHFSNTDSHSHHSSFQCSQNFDSCDLNGYNCQTCDISFCDVSSLQNHIISTHRKEYIKREKKFKCNSCPASFYRAAHLKVHRFVHTGERPYICNTCGKGYMEAYKLKIHQRNHTGERPYTCPDCNKSFKWSAAFTRHRRTHTGEKPYSCDRCSATFSGLTSLQRHSLTHSKERPYQCMCGSTFSDPSALKVHKRIHTGERPFTCSICGASFIRAQHLKAHNKLHSGEKPFECEICYGKFTEASKLRSHMRKHTGEKPYMCQSCGKSFAWTAAYNRHMRIHTMEKPYLCRICGNTFVDNTSLARHRRIHTGERPYHCNQCSSTFRDSSSLSRHMKVHSGEKAFVCDVCGAKFSQKTYLTRHHRIHTGDKPYECCVCSEKFSDSSKLSKHKKTHIIKTEPPLKTTKHTDCLHLSMNPDPASEKPELTHLQEQDIGSYLSPSLQFHPPQDRTVHGFEDLPVTNCVLDAILNIKS